MKNNRIMNILYIIILLIILFLPKINIINIPGIYIGIRIEDFLIALFVILYFIKKNILKFDNKLLKKTLLYFSVYIVLCTISTISGIVHKNIETFLGILYVLRKIEYFLFIFIGYDFFKNNKNKKLFLNLLDASVIIHFVIIILQNFGIIGGVLNGNYINVVSGRIFSTFNGPHEFSAYMVLLLPLYYINIIKHKKQIIKSILLILFIIISVYMSQSRTSFIIILILLLIIPILEIRYEIMNFIKANKKKTFVVVAIIITLIIGMIILALKTGRFKTLEISSMLKTLKLSWDNKSFERYKEEGFYIISEENTDLSFAIRINKWMALIDGIIEKPILGIGPSITKEASDGNYIRILAESGLVGFGVWIGLIINILKSTKNKQNNINMLARYGMLGLLMSAIFIDVFEASKIMMFYWFILGCAYVTNNFKEENENIEKNNFMGRKNMKKNVIVAILMATYNGEKYLKEQIDSILSQTYQNFILYIRDDNSIDGTKKIIQEYKKIYSDKIIEVDDEKNAGGSCKNFMYLLEYVYNLNKYELFMFADQDDFWQKDKIEITVKEYNKVSNKEQPIVVHTDLNVVDSNLNLICKSFIKYSSLNSNNKTFNKYLTQNNVTGCTMLINKSLVELVEFDIKNIIMHDWYFALIASAFGQVIFVNSSTVKYRQHNKNVLGAKNVNRIKNICERIKSNFKNNIIKRDLNELFKQAESFKEKYYELLTDKNKNIINDFCEIKTSNKIKKIIIINKNNFYKQGVVRKIGEIIFI